MNQRGRDAGDRTVICKQRTHQLCARAPPARRSAGPRRTDGDVYLARESWEVDALAGAAVPVKGGRTQKRARCRARSGGERERERDFASGAASWRSGARKVSARCRPPLRARESETAIGCGSPRAPATRARGAGRARGPSLF